MQAGAVKSLTLYSEPRYDGIDFSEVCRYVGERLAGTPVSLRGPLLEGYIAAQEPQTAGELTEQLAWGMARSRVRRLDSQHERREPMLGEVDYERRRLIDRKSRVFGLLYDAHELAGVLAPLVPERQRGLGHVHVVFTSQLIGTWDEGDRRYHARTVLMGSPAIVSLSGLVEAPARAPAYYLARRSGEAWGLGEEQKMELAREFAEDCLCHGDPRMTEAAKGYVLQVMAYRITGTPFCEDPDCRLYNAHWQRELIQSQLGGRHEFCSRHEGLFSTQQRKGR